MVKGCAHCGTAFFLPRIVPCAQILNNYPKIFCDELYKEFQLIISSAFSFAFLALNFLCFFFSKNLTLFCIALGLHYLCMSKAIGLDRTEKI